MDKKDIHWESLIKKCPHCGTPLSIHHVSTVSEKHLVGMLYQSLENHYFKDCINHDSRKAIDVEMEVEGRYGNYGKSISYKKMKLIV